MTKAGNQRPEFHARDGRPLYRGRCNGLQYIIIWQPLREAMPCDPEFGEAAGWSAIVALPGHDPAVDYPAVCVETFAEAEQAAREYLGEWQAARSFTPEQKRIARALNAAVARRLLA